MGRVETDRPIRRKDRVITEEETLELLERGVYGVLATVGQDGQPYGVPLSYTVWNGSIYFHCALTGHKLDNLAFCPRASFTVVGKVQAVYEKDFSTYYESAVVFGVASKVEDKEEAVEALRRLAEKYLPEHMDKADGDIARSFSRTAVYKISMDQVTGKSKKPRPAR